MKGMNGLELCARIVANRPDIPVVVITAFGSLEAAIEAIRAGAYDFVTKPFETKTLTLALDRAVQHRTLRHEVRRLREQIDRARPVPDLIGESAALRPVRDLIERLGDSDASVLITGRERHRQGAGGAGAARHRAPARRGRSSPSTAPPCPSRCSRASCSATPGAPSPTPRRRAPACSCRPTAAPCFSTRSATCRASLQVKLLRALQERRIRPVGADSETPFDVRLVCATNRDLETAIEERRFREDLYFRINVVQVALPPLRARGNDILLLAQHFLGRFAAQTQKSVQGLSPAAAEKLMAYPWPGNVRELQNAIERAVALTRFEEICVDDLPDRIRNYQASQLLVEGPGSVRAGAAGGGGAPLRPAGAGGGGRPPIGRRPGAGHRSQDAVPQAGAVGGRRGSTAEIATQKQTPRNRHAGCTSGRHGHSPHPAGRRRRRSADHPGRDLARPGPPGERGGGRQPPGRGAGGRPGGRTAGVRSRRRRYAHAGLVGAGPAGRAAFAPRLPAVHPDERLRRRGRPRPGPAAGGPGAAGKALLAEGAAGVGRPSGGRCS